MILLYRQMCMPNYVRYEENKFKTVRSLAREQAYGTRAAQELRRLQKDKISCDEQTASSSAIAWHFENFLFSRKRSFAFHAHFDLWSCGLKFPLLRGSGKNLLRNVITISNKVVRNTGFYEDCCFDSLSKKIPASGFRFSTRSDAYLLF